MNSRVTNHFEREYAAENNSALSVSEGVGEQPVVNPHYTRVRRPQLSIDDYVEGIRSGNISVLSQAITLIESNSTEHYTSAQQIIERCLPFAGRSIRVGITGVPGAGKSTFIEAVGGHITIEGHRVAVLAIDPSSERSGGSILGDKTRMETLANNPKVFIRPSPSAGELGGVARKTRESIILCEAAGFDVVLIETVGVGQSETAVHSMTDVFLLLQISGAGDELQGIKRGIMEMADIVAITKADGDNLHRAELAATQIRSALHLFPMPLSNVRPSVLTTSSLTGDGIDGIWKGIMNFVDITRANGYFERNRARQNRWWMSESIEETLKYRFYNDPEIKTQLNDYERRVEQGEITSFRAAKELLDKYFD